MAKITIDQFYGITAEALPLAAQFGFRVDRIEPGRVWSRVPFTQNLMRPGGTVAGPVLMGLADYTMYAIVMSLIGPIAGTVTTNLNINFLRRPGPADIVADGRILKLGKRLAVSEVTLYSEGDPAPVAHVTGTHSIPPHPEPADSRSIGVPLR